MSQRKFTFTTEEVTLLFNAMGHMAGVYREDAKTMEKSDLLSPQTRENMVDQFKRQSDVA